MTDPIAEAAANLQQQDAAPSSTERSLIDEVKAGIHALEEKLEHLIHPETQEVAQEPSGEPVPGESAIIDSTPIPATGDAPSATSESPTSTNTESQGASISETTDTTSEATGEAGNAAPAVAGESSGASASRAAEAPNDYQWTPEQLATIKAAHQPLTINKIDLAAASPAAETSASATASSAPPASPASVMQAASDSGVLERARLSIDRLRAHFWTFDTSAVKHLHNELDFLEGLFK